MTISKWDPMRELRAMQEQMNRLLEMSRDRSLDEPFEEGQWQPPADIFEDEREVVIKLEIPGLDQKDIEVQIEDNTLVISGERTLENADQRQNYHRVERHYGPFRRTFALPATVDQERTRASCEKGILRVVLPKQSTPEPRQIEVKVE